MSGRTVCVNRARTGLWGSRWATTGSTRRRRGEKSPRRPDKDIHKLALLLIQLRKRIYGPVAFGILRHRPALQHRPDSAFERVYHKIDAALDEAIRLLAA
jgi:hypothetical protein